MRFFLSSDQLIHVGGLRFFLICLITLTMAGWVSVADSPGISGMAFQGGSYVSDTFPEQIGVGIQGQHSITFSNTGMVAWESKVETFGVSCEVEKPGIHVEPLFASIPKGTQITPGKSYEFVFILKTDSPGIISLKFIPARMTRGTPIPIGDPHLIEIECSPGGGSANTNTGSLQILTGEQPLRALVDGEERGFTPIQIPRIAPGIHQVSLFGKDINQTYQTKVKIHETTVLSIDPSSRQLCLTAALMPTNSDENPLIALLVSNFIISLGFFLGLTLTGGYATLLISKKVKDSKNRLGQISPCSSAQESQSRDIRVETRRSGTKKPDIIFDPLMMMCDEGSVGEVRIKATNLGIRPVKIEGLTVSEDESKYIIIQVPTDQPGDHLHTRDLLFLDASGREFIRSVVIRYKVLPVEPSLDWRFSRFIFGKNKIIAVLKVKNSSNFQVSVGDMDLPPQIEEEIELEMPDLNDDTPEVKQALSIRWGQGKQFDLGLLIPYNRGVFLKNKGKFNEALAYYRKLLSRDSGSADLWIQQGELLKKLGNHDGSRKSYLQAELLDPTRKIQTSNSSTNRESKLSKSEKVCHDISDFPHELLSLYKPLVCIGTDKTGTMYLAERVSDKSQQMVKILDPLLSPLPSLRLAMQTWRSLHHPHILRLSGWESEPVPFFETYPPEGVIQKRARRYSIADLSVPVPMRAALVMGIGICRGLSYLHRQGARHYLLDPSVIFLDRKLHVRIGGFDGLVTLSGKDCHSSCWFLAPEQRFPERYGNSGKKTDIYQAGALLYLLLTGSHPYGQNDLPDNLQTSGINSFPLVLPSQIRSDLGHFDKILTQCLSVDKNERYNSVDDLIQDLESVQTIISERNKKQKTE